MLLIEANLEKPGTKAGSRIQRRDSITQSCHCDCGRILPVFFVRKSTIVIRKLLWGFSPPPRFLRKILAFTANSGTYHTPSLERHVSMCACVRFRSSEHNNYPTRARLSLPQHPGRQSNQDRSNKFSLITARQRPP